MARRVPDFDSGGTDFEDVAFLEGFVFVFHRRTLMDIDVRACGQAQFLITAHMIGMHMGVDDNEEKLRRF